MVTKSGVVLLATASLTAAAWVHGYPARAVPVPVAGFRTHADAAAERAFHRFTGGMDGFYPTSGVISDRSGALYGTTGYGGGTGNMGTVFELTPSSKGYAETILHRFPITGPDGSGPSGGLIADASGALYGTTVFGGTAFAGIFFKLSPASSGYTEQILYNFQGGNNAASPDGGLIADANMNFYGTSGYGGADTSGTVFKLVPAGSVYTEKLLYAFTGGSDGNAPLAGLVADKYGNLYGTTFMGGNTQCYCGVVFKLAPSKRGKYVESDIHTFTGGADGANPQETLVMGSDGALYGSTNFGGPPNNGIIFKLSARGTTYREDVLFAFGGGPNGSNPSSPVFLGPHGFIYGTTYDGGSSTGCSGYGCGVVYRLTPSSSGYTESVLYTFQGPDGANPTGALLFDATTNSIYDTAATGGEPKKACGDSGCGVVFRLRL